MPERLRKAVCDPLRLYILLAPLFYLAFALLTPPFETPDEHQHLFRAWQLSEGGLIAERRGDEVGGELPTGLLRAVESELGTVAAHARRQPHAEPWPDRISRATPVDASGSRIFTDFRGSAPYAPVGYLPQIISIWMGKAVGLSVEGMVLAGRLLNALLTVALLAAAMRILPMGRNMLLLVGLLPMTAASAASFGQDGLVIGTASLVLAMGLRAKFTRKWSTGGGVLFGLLTAVLTLAKFVYLPLAGIALLTGGGGGGRWRFGQARVPLVATVFAGAMFLGWMSLVAGLTVQMSPDKPLPAEQLQYLLAHPQAFPAALAGTYDWAGLVDKSQTLFRFGWLQVGPVLPAWYASWLAALLLLAGGTGAGPRLDFAMRAWLLALFIAVVLILSFALYLGASRLGAAGVDGVQGRYFIPALLLLLLPLGRGGGGERIFLPAVAAGLLVMANAASLAAIVKAFYL